MYPCSNPELVAAVSEAGGIGVLQPVSLTFVHGHEFAAGLQYLRTLTAKPLGMNGCWNIAHLPPRRGCSTALDQGVRFFITSLGNPRWVVQRVTGVGGVVYHDVTERKWADKALAAGVHGLIAVNDRAGGHAGGRSAKQLAEELTPLGLPLVCAGGIGAPADFARALALGYDAVQLGTRLIATTECTASKAYKAAIVAGGRHRADERITGVPLALIRTPYVELMARAAALAAC
jgi:nitronate monooxygenase